MTVCTGTQQSSQTSFARSIRLNSYLTQPITEENVRVVIKYMYCVIKYRSFIQAQISLFSFLSMYWSNHDSKNAKSINLYLMLGEVAFHVNG